MGLDDAVNDGEAEAAVVCALLCAEKGLEDVLKVFFINSCAGIRKSEYDVSPGRQVCVTSICNAVLGRDYQAATVRHGFNGVHAHVEQRLLDVIGIGMNRPETILDTCVNGNELGHGPLENMADIAYRHAQVQRVLSDADVSAEDE